VALLVKRNTSLKLGESEATVRIEGVECTGFIFDKQTNHVDSVDVTFDFTTSESRTPLSSSGDEKC